MWAGASHTPVPGRGMANAASTVATMKPACVTATVRLAARQTDGTMRYFRGTYEVAQVAAGGDAPLGTLEERITGASIAPE